jgi:hypothetical protein
VDEAEEVRLRTCRDDDRLGKAVEEGEKAWRVGELEVFVRLVEFEVVDIGVNPRRPLWC